MSNERATDENKINNAKKNKKYKILVITLAKKTYQCRQKRYHNNDQ